MNLSDEFLNRLQAHRFASRRRDPDRVLPVSSTDRSHVAVKQKQVIRR